MVRIKVFSWIKDAFGVHAIIKGFDCEKEHMDEAIEKAMRYLSRQKGQRILAVGDFEIQRAFELIGAERG